MSEINPASAQNATESDRRRRLIADRRLQAAKARYAAGRTGFEVLSDSVADATGSMQFSSHMSSGSSSGSCSTSGSACRSSGAADKQLTAAFLSLT